MSNVIIAMTTSFHPSFESHCIGLTPIPHRLYPEHKKTGPRTGLFCHVLSELNALAHRHLVLSLVKVDEHLHHMN